MKCLFSIMIMSNLNNQDQQIDLNKQLQFQQLTIKQILYIIIIFYFQSEFKLKSLFICYLRIIFSIIYIMSMLAANISNDDYKNDFKPDQSVSPINEALSNIAWAPTIPNVFASTSWDGELRIYQVNPQGFYNQQGGIIQKISYKFPTAALKCTWNDQSTQIYVGLMDGTIKVYDVNSGQVGDIGRQNAAISSLHFVPGMNTIVSSGYQSNIQFWQMGNPNPVMTINAENKVYTTDFLFPMLVAGTQNQRILLLDINNPNSKTVVESADLGKFSQIQSIAINLKCNMFGIASFDGRANLSTINKNVNGLFAPKTVITFKSNKQEEGGNTILYPINSLSFNPINEKWFMTAGSDGIMNFWDYQAKNKIKSLNYGGFPICTAKVSPKGDMVAYGLGNDWHLGAEGAKWQTKMGVHPIGDNETKFTK